VAFLASQAELDYKDAQRKREVSYYTGNPPKGTRGHLYDFCVDILGYDALSPTFHKPMLDEWDRLDLRRMRQRFGNDPIDDSPIDRLDLWPRGHIKTWCQRAAVIRYALIDPTITVTWWHAVEDKAVESAESIGEQFIKNTKLRALFPAGVLPAMNRKKFCASGSFRLNSQRIGDAPSMMAMGSGGESTGAHSRVGVLDDFVGYQDVVNSQMNKKKEFYRATVRNVVLRTSNARGWIDAIGTHWAMDDPYVDWRNSPDWISTVRACLETDGVPDYKGSPVYLSQEQIDKELREQGPTIFAYQMMNDPSPSGAKPWIPEECEHTCTLEAAKGPGHVVLLIDPAPRAVGSLGWEGRAGMKSGTKNYWANVIVKLRRVGERQELVLLDAEQSKDWGLDEGMDRAAKMAIKWHANEAYCETTSTPIYLETFLRSKKELGMRAYVIGSRRQHDANDRLRATYNAGAKVSYIGALADRAKAHEVVVCDSFPLRDEFFGQMRAFMPMSDGRTGIPFDDLVNAVAFATDPYFRNRYQAVSDEWSFSPFKSQVDERPESGTRYVRW
jgi:hypothetical protein